MKYYAHIRQLEDGRVLYQTVQEHLEGTAALAEQFAATFGAERQGKLAGLGFVKAAEEQYVLRV